MLIRQAKLSDAKAICEVYNPYIAETIITFETEILDDAEMESRISNILTKYDWLVVEENGKIAGYAYYGQFRTRTAYNHTVESAIYLNKELKGRGYGKMLYEELFRSAKLKGYREIIGVIALPNPESVIFHQKNGFHEAGLLVNTGYKFGKYIDVIFMQKTL